MSNNNNSSSLFQAVFENNPIGLVVVNGDTSLQSMNNYMFATFRIDQKNFHEHFLGNALKCSNIYLTGKKCGEDKLCNDCCIRRILNSTMVEGINVPETVFAQNFIINGSSCKKWFNVSASRVAVDGEIFGVLSFVDITSQIEYEKSLKRQLSLDAATGTINKFALIKLLKNLLNDKKGLTVAMIDLDDFKSVNDQYGHLVGDKVLNLFCSATFTNIREQDMIGRFGGEEFMIIFPSTGTGFVINVLKRISASFSTSCMNEFGFSTTFSAGIAEFSSENIAGITADAIIVAADENLYISKNAGKNRVTAFNVSNTFD